MVRKKRNPARWEKESTDNRQVSQEEHPACTAVFLELAEAHHPPQEVTQDEEGYFSAQEDILLFDPDEMTEALATGGFGVVFAVPRLGDSLPMIVKVASVDEEENEEDNDCSIRILNDEKSFYELMHNSGGRPWMPKFYGSGTFPIAAKEPWIAIEHLGSDLYDFTHSGKAAKMFRHLALGMLSAVKGLHCEGFIHRDIKPANFVLRDAEGELPEVCLVDYGLVIQYDVEEPDDHHQDDDYLEFYGTFEYASTRQLREKMLGPADDLESLGYSLLQIWLAEEWWDIKPAKVKKEKKAAGLADGVCGKRGREGADKEAAAPSANPRNLRQPRIANTMSPSEKCPPSATKRQRDAPGAAPGKEDARKNAPPAAKEPESCDGPKTLNENCKKILEQRNTAWELLVEQGKIPQFIQNWVHYCKGLSAYECPNYTFLRALLQHCAPEEAPAAVKLKQLGKSQKGHHLKCKEE